MHNGEPESTARSVDVRECRVVSEWRDSRHCNLFKRAAVNSLDHSTKEQEKILNTF